MHDEDIELGLLKNPTFCKYLYAYLIFHTFWAHVSRSELNSCLYGSIWWGFFTCLQTKSCSIAMRIIQGCLSPRTSHRRPGFIYFAWADKQSQRKWAAIYSNVIRARIQAFQGWIQVVFLSESWQLMRAKQSMMTAANEKEELEE